MIPKRHAIPICILVAFLFVAWAIRPSANERFAHFLIANRLCSDKWRSQTEAALRLLTRGTAFENKWEINSELVRDGLNVYCVKRGVLAHNSAVPRRYTALAGNAAYIGSPNVIVLDDELIDDFLPQRLKEYETKFGGHPWMPTGSDVFIVWVLGHEIGHLVLGHGPAHFDGKGLTGQVSAASVSFDRELEADGFIVDSLANAHSHNEDVFLLMHSLAGIELAKYEGVVVMGPGLPHRSNEFRFDSDKGHPDYFVRCIRSLDLAIKKGVLPKSDIWIEVPTIANMLRLTAAPPTHVSAFVYVLVIISLCVIAIALTLWRRMTRPLMQ